MKKLIAGLTTCIMLFVCTFSLSGCGILYYDFHTSGDFMYTIGHSPDGTRTYATIRKFSEQGKEKEVIVVPKEIDGYEVAQYGDNRHGAMPPAYVYIESEKLKRIYFCDSNVDIEDEFAFQKCEKLNCMIFAGTRENGEYVVHDSKGSILAFDFLRGISGDCRVYVYYDIYQYYCQHVYEVHQDMTMYRRVMKNTLPGTVNYYYNYEDAPNDGYYWLDDYDYGEKIAYPPEDPTREGYVFGGWYKESECENAWDYATDTLPEKIIAVGGETVYQETKLFAKWVLA